MDSRRELVSSNEQPRRKQMIDSRGIDRNTFREKSNRQTVPFRTFRKIINNFALHFPIIFISFFYQGKNLKTGFDDLFNLFLKKKDNNSFFFEEDNFELMERIFENPRYFVHFPGSVKFITTSNKWNIFVRFVAYAQDVRTMMKTWEETGKMWMLLHCYTHLVGICRYHNI